MANPGQGSSSALAQSQPATTDGNPQSSPPLREASPARTETNSDITYDDGPQDDGQDMGGTSAGVSDVALSNILISSSLTHRRVPSRIRNKAVRLRPAPRQATNEKEKRSSHRQAAKKDRQQSTADPGSRRRMSRRLYLKVVSDVTQFRPPGNPSADGIRIHLSEVAPTVKQGQWPTACHSGAFVLRTRYLRRRPLTLQEVTHSAWYGFIVLMPLSNKLMLYLAGDFEFEYKVNCEWSYTCVLTLQPTSSHTSES